MPVNMFIDEIFVLGKSDEEHLPANGIKGEISIDLPSIEVKTLSSNIDVNVVANYTQGGLPVAPFAMQKDFGSGKVTYLNIDLLLESILSERVVMSPHEILAKILEIAGIVG